MLRTLSHCSVRASELCSPARPPLALLTAFGLMLSLSSPAHGWWNEEWTVRKKITLDPGAGAGEVSGSVPVLVRLHDANFQFLTAKEDASDLRFLASDDKTLLAFHVEKYDSLLNEAFVWVKIPDLKPGAPVSIWLYYGNQGPKAVKVEDAKATYDGDPVLVYHFGEQGAPANDASGSGNTAANAGLPVPGSLIGSGLRLDGKSAVTIPASDSLIWTEGGSMTWSAWIKASALQPNAVIFTRRDETSSFVIGVDNGAPFVEVTSAAGTQRTAGGEPIALNVWKHLAVVAQGAKVSLYLDGEPYSTVAVGIPALNVPSTLGFTVPAEAVGTEVVGFTGEIDELQIAKSARPVSFIKLASINQSGSDKAAALLAMSDDEASKHGGGGEIAEHLSLFADISKSLTFDGWVVIILCALLAVIGWAVAIAKFMYLNTIKKATDAFLKQWKTLSADLTVLDHGDEQSIKSMGGKANPKAQKIMRPSPLYHIYQIGSQEIQHRAANARDGFKGLSGRSMQAIRATLDGGLIREVKKLNENLVFLTIGIAGGPYLGLLGTVIGVMITFAVIAKTGEVEVNSIAPGIAGALLATVAGLAVAIPALFAYSYLSSRIKDAVSEMQMFIDEFVAKIAEFYPSSND